MNLVLNKLATNNNPNIKRDDIGGSTLTNTACRSFNCFKPTEQNNTDNT